MYLTTAAVRPVVNININFTGKPWKPESQSFRGEAMGLAQAGQPWTAAGRGL